MGHNFSCWFLPLKGQEVRNSWAVCVPMMQYGVMLVVLSVSFLIVFAHDEPLDIVMDSLGFTFIAEVGSFFNAPLAKQMAATKIVSSCMPDCYGEVFYLYPEYKESNALNDDGTYCDHGWYILKDESKAGLLSDYKIRHSPGRYPQRYRRTVLVLERGFWAVPVCVVVIAALRCR